MYYSPIAPFSLYANFTLFNDIDTETMSTVRLNAHAIMKRYTLEVDESIIWTGPDYIYSADQLIVEYIDDKGKQ